MDRRLRATLLASTLALALAGPASAAEPNVQGCLGQDFSTYAREGVDGLYPAGSGFGQFNAALAQWVPGLGAPIQIHLAGLIPDGYIPNSCND